MRLFVAVTPPETVLDEVEELHAQLRGQLPPSASGVRWTRRDQWHVTLRFLGEVPDPAPVVAALEQLRPAGGASQTEAVVGAVELLGRSVLCLPVGGLTDLAAAVTEVTAGLGQPPETRPYYGHLTLARLPHRRRPDPKAWIGWPFGASWPATEIELFRSHRVADRSRYEVLRRLALP